MVAKAKDKRRLIWAVPLACLALILGGVKLAPSAPPPVVPKPVATKAGFVCPSNSRAKRMRFWIHVNKWCYVPGIREQIQLKVQMKIRNQSDEHSLDISQDRIRVVVHHLDPDRWTPPREGASTLDRPVRTIYRGEQVWAIPPNADGAFDYLPNKPHELTFATHWVNPETLGPGQMLRPHFHYGDLVYYIPMSHHHRRGAVKRNVIGIAYVKGRDIIALCPPWAWGKHEFAALF